MPQLIDNDTLLSGICWHLECMKLSAIAIEDFRPPADLFQMRMHYSLYLTNLLAAIDLIFDNCSSSNLGNLEEALQCQTFSGTDVLGYMRELRNSVVHRGFDPTAGGLVLNGVTYAIAPSTVKNKNGSRSYSSPTNLLRELYMHCERCAKPLMERYLKSHIESVGVELPEEILRNTIDSFDAIPHMPGSVKEMARQHTTPEMLSHVRDHRITTVMFLLGSLAGWRT